MADFDIQPDDSQDERQRLLGSIAAPNTVPVRPAAQTAPLVAPPTAAAPTEGSPVAPKPVVAPPVAAPTSAAPVAAAPATAAPTTKVAGPQGHEGFLESLYKRESNIKNPFLKTLAKVGTGIARGAEGIASPFVPELSFVPGTELNAIAQNRRDAAAQAEAAKEKVAQENAESERTRATTGETTAGTEREKADTDKWKAEHPNQTPAEFVMSRISAGGKLGDPDVQAAIQAENAMQKPGDFKTWQLPDGTTTNLPANQKPPDGAVEYKTPPTDTTKLAPEIEAQIGPSPDPKNYPLKDKDPKYKADHEAWGKAAEKLKNEEAAASGAARGAGYNQSRPVQVLVPQPDGSMAAVWMPAGLAEQAGYSAAGPGATALSRTAQISDIVNASQKVRSAIGEAGMTAFTPVQTAKLSMAMKETDPSVMRDEIANLAASGLTPEQQDLVTWLYQLQERALSLRNIAGMGQGSDMTRGAILRALPGITSGNPQMAIKQLDAFDNMVSNLSKGILSVPGSQKGNAGGGAKAEPWIQKNSKGQFRYSTDGGKTWRTGKPPKQQ